MNATESSQMQVVSATPRNHLILQNPLAGPCAATGLEVDPALVVEALAAPTEPDCGCKPLAMLISSSSNDSYSYSPNYSSDAGPLLSLPAEILVQVIDLLDPSALTPARLACRTLNGLVSRRAFALLVAFLDPAVAQATIEAAACNARLRRHSRSIWSPRCAVPAALPVTRDFLLAVWAGLRGESYGIYDDPRRDSSSDTSSSSGIYCCCGADAGYYLSRAPAVRSAPVRNGDGGRVYGDAHGAAVCGAPPPSQEHQPQHHHHQDEDDDDDDELSLRGLQTGLDRADLTDDVLRAALFRYVLYLSYVSPGSTRHPWVFDALLRPPKAKPCAPCVAQPSPR